MHACTDSVGPSCSRPKHEAPKQGFLKKEWPDVMMLQALIAGLKCRWMGV
jgi:hypothetical protein